MYYFKYNKIYNKYYNLSNYYYVNYRLNRTDKVMPNKLIK